MGFWPSFWGPGRQKQQAIESRQRVEAELMRNAMNELTFARIESEEASRAVRSAVAKRLIETRPLRAVLKDVIRRQQGRG